MYTRPLLIMLLKFKNLSKFGQSVFSTHGCPDNKKSEKKLRKMAKKLSNYKYSPIWVNADHGTALVTTQSLDRTLIKGAIYEVDLEVQAYEFRALVFVKKCKLITQPKTGKVMKFCDSDDSDSEDIDAKTDDDGEDPCL